MQARLARVCVAMTTLSLCAAAQVSDARIRINPFGYLPASKKVAVLRAAVVGFDAPLTYTPASRIEVRRVRDASVAFAAAPIAWNGGAVHAQSGDRVWRVDFSALREVGSFRIYDPRARIASEPFRIATDVYAEALRQACRMFFYQRSGFAKRVPFADPKWVDAASHLGPQQDLDCRLVTNPVPSTSKNLSGGWYDAGDFNKYVNFADDVVHALSSAFRARPRAWPDDFGIPESRNGEPDLLDEMRFELDWLLRMQQDDGSVLHKVSVVDFASSSPPSTDRSPRRYGPATASATIAACGAFAHAARAFRAWGSKNAVAYAQRLQAAALLSWRWLEANTSKIPSRYDNVGFQSVAAEDSAYHQAVNQLRAAIHLAHLTGDAKFKRFVEARYKTVHVFAWQSTIPWEQPWHQALLEYADWPSAAASVAAEIRRFVANGVERDYASWIATDLDPYGAVVEDRNYTWGSNSLKSLQGLQFTMMNRYGLRAQRAAAWSALGEGYVHYLFGVNPLGYCFLTNMKAFGAERSAQEMYHGWFADGTDWDNATFSKFGPAPGYLTGGVNPAYKPASAYSGAPIVPPMQQPIQKSYKDWNTSWPQNSWEVTEPAIGYQGNFVQLLAYAALPRPQRVGLELRDFEVGKTATITLGSLPQGRPWALFVGGREGRFRLDLPSWCFDLGLDLGANPGAALLLVGFGDARGGAEIKIPVQPALRGIRAGFQVSAAGACPDVFQSALRFVTVR